MAAIKLHLEAAESDAVARYAEAIGTKPEAVAYAALNRLMLAARDPAVKQDILQTWSSKAQGLPLWADSAQSVHAYEGKPDDDPEPSRYLNSV